MFSRGKHSIYEERAGTLCETSVGSVHSYHYSNVVCSDSNPARKHVKLAVLHHPDKIYVNRAKLRQSLGLTVSVDSNCTTGTTEHVQLDLGAPQSQQRTKDYLADETALLHVFRLRHNTMHGADTASVVQC